VSEPRFLTVRQVEKLHSLSIARFGGTLGIRDRNTFEAAVFHPQNVYSYSQVDLFELAAAYCFHIAEAQAFLDGNKRTAASAALTFLRLNGISIRDETSALEELLLGVAEKRYRRKDIAERLRALVDKSS